VPGDPHALLLEETVADMLPGAVDRLGLTARESEVLRAATVIEGEAELAWELFLSLHAVRERLARLEAKLEVRTADDAVTRVLRESLKSCETLPRNARLRARSHDLRGVQGRPAGGPQHRGRGARRSATEDARRSR
jgi:DNA-binding CsgD family transcriptional regulator